MQLNIYVPDSKKWIFEMLEEAALKSKKSKSEIVIEALEKYLLSADQLPLGRFKIGAHPSLRRADLYAERVDRT
ncbi:hypothetical protein [Hydrogenibacillus sp. N12]|uniref:hypothetical protein n=1 Tax=Hydrogenibacillus sp. N12 TaxID=2866627 RepID=UPI001C7D94C6|nr:hypothetical protein [Hydrogenibacillus sp. N12]QZA32376.1 hypothetical protein K2M58_08605 [Hydrogenibacillus sp. N12]